MTSLDEHPLRTAVEEASAREPGADGAVALALNTLRQLVLKGGLKANEQIRQDEMAALIGVSRVPLREALRALASEGLLTHRRNQGYFVSALSVDEFRQIVALLEYLEIELIRSARWPTPEQVQELRILNQRLAEAAPLADPHVASEINRTFHIAVFRLSPMKFFVSEAERYWNLAEPYRNVHVVSTNYDEIIDEHEQLVDALAAHDRALSIRVMNEHRRTTLSGALTALSEQAPVSRNS